MLTKRDQRKTLKAFACNYLRPDVVLVLRILANNVNGMVVSELVKKLWDAYFTTASLKKLDAEPRRRVPRRRGGGESSGDDDEQNDIGNDDEDQEEKHLAKFPTDEFSVNEAPRAKTSFPQGTAKFRSSGKNGDNQVDKSIPTETATDV